MQRSAAFTSVLFLFGVVITGLTSPGRAQPGSSTPPAPAAAGRGRGAPPGPVTIHAARILDGKGGIIRDGVITIQGTKITAIGPRTPQMTSYTYDLGDSTLLPGMIDVHVHLNWYFGPNGRYGQGPYPPAYVAAAIQENAAKTLLAGFTTVQSVGWAGDKGLREAIAAGVIVGPRLLSSLDQIIPGNATPEELRERVRRDKANGADLIKLFASGSIREGGRMNVTKAQIEAVCGEAKAQGLRTLVHAHDPASIIACVNAGCS